MKGLLNPDNRYGDDKSSAACSLFGMLDTTGRRFSSEAVIRAITNMHDRSNGLGGGFAAYGIYPQYPEHYALHVMYMSQAAKANVETYLRAEFDIEHAEPIPTSPANGIVNPPDVWRYFALPKQLDGLSGDDTVVQRVMHVNTSIADAFIFSSGRNMGVFKGVGFPEAIARYFRLEEYQGYLWTVHGRFPTNTPGWWGGAHPFNVLDWTVVHNGELSSYGINRRHLEMFGYFCTLQTDTEVAAYAVDLLVRRHGHSIETLAKILAAPLWSEIDRMPPRERALHQTLRQVYGSLLLNGPFTIIIAHTGQMIGLTDRIRLRPLVAGVRGDVLYLSSEESAIHLVCPDVERTWTPMGGEPVVGTVGVAPGPPKSAATTQAAGRKSARGRG
ncbi:MAG: glutamine amidotransferase family protein [Dehalococcoidia bacterium]|nr:glutamine amidotransferase family protein [Dehalococcoidia bacterium]